MRQFRKRMLGNVLAVAVVISSLAVIPVSATDNTDIKFDDTNGHWAESYIKEFIKNGYIDGYEDGTFKPDNNITRAEFIKMINKAFGFSDKGDENFVDVNENDWFYDEVLKAVKAGYIDGYEEDGVLNFKPDENINREEACKIVGSILKANADGNTDFKDDAQISNWAKKYVKGLTDMGVIDGFEDNTFRPQDSKTRAESVKTIYQAKSDEGSGDGGDVTPPVADKNIIIDSNDDFDKLDTTTYDSIIIQNDANGILKDINAKSVKIESGDITVEDCKFDNVIIGNEISKSINDINLTVIGKTELNNIVINSKSVISIDKDVTVENLVIEPTADGSKVEGSGTITNVDINADDIAISEDIVIENKNLFEGKVSFESQSINVSVTPLVNIDLGIFSKDDIKVEYLDVQGKVLKKKDKTWAGYLNDDTGNKYGKGANVPANNYSNVIESGKIYSTTINHPNVGANTADYFEKVAAIRVTVKNGESSKVLVFEK